MFTEGQKSIGRPRRAARAGPPCGLSSAPATPASTPEALWPAHRAVGGSEPPPSRRGLEALGAHPRGAALILTKSLRFALYAVLRIPAPAVKGIRLRSQPNAPRNARHFVASTLRDWQVPMAIALACLVASELVTRSTLYDSTGDGIDLTVAWNRQSLRLAVADQTPDVRHRQHEGPDQEERGLATVAGVLRAHGVLPRVRPEGNGYPRLRCPNKRTHRGR